MSQVIGLAAKRLDIADRFGPRLRESRKAEGLSQMKLANELGLNHSYINRLESGERLPSTELLIRLARRYDWSIDDVLGIRP